MVANALPRGCQASVEVVGAPCEVFYEPLQPRNCMRCAPTPTNKGSESARLHRKFSYRTPGATPRVFNPSLLRLGAAAGLRRPRDAPLRARYWLHRGTHCSWQALSGTPRSDSCIGRPCHAAEDELGPARLATLLGILSALGRRSKTHRAQQRAATRSAPAPSFAPTRRDHGPLRDRRLRHGAL